MAPSPALWVIRPCPWPWGESFVLPLLFMWRRDLQRALERSGARAPGATFGWTVVVVLTLVSVATWFGLHPVGGSTEEIVVTLPRDEVVLGPVVASTSTTPFTTQRGLLTMPTTTDSVPGSSFIGEPDRTIIVPAVPQTLPSRAVAPPATASPTTAAPVVGSTTTPPPVTAAPTTVAPTTTNEAATTAAPTTTTDAPVTVAPSTTTDAPTTVAPTTEVPIPAPTTVAPTTTEAPTTTVTIKDDDDLLDRFCFFFPRSRLCS